MDEYLKGIGLGVLIGVLLPLVVLIGIGSVDALDGQAHWDEYFSFYLSALPFLPVAGAIFGAIMNFLVAITTDIGKEEEARAKEMAKERRSRTAEVPCAPR